MFLANTHQCVQFHQSWCVLLIDALHVRSRLCYSCLLFLFVDFFYFIDSYKLCGAHFLLRFEGMRSLLKPCTTKPFAIVIVVFILSIVYMEFSFPFAWISSYLDSCRRVSTRLPRFSIANFVCAYVCVSVFFIVPSVFIFSDHFGHNTPPQNDDWTEAAGSGPNSLLSYSYGVFELFFCFVFISYTFYISCLSSLFGRFFDLFLQRSSSFCFLYWCCFMFSICCFLEFFDIVFFFCWKRSNEPFQSRPFHLMKI